MIRFAFAVALTVATLAATAVAAEKETTVTGKVTCAKCDLAATDACATVVKDGDKVYYFDPAASKKYHKDACQSPREGTVTGTVSKDGDKDVIKVTKVEYKK